MRSYVCIIYRKDDEVLAVESYERADDEAAIKEAEALAISYQGCRGFELWQGGSKVTSNLPKAGHPSDYERFAKKV